MVYVECWKKIKIDGHITNYSISDCGNVRNDVSKHILKPDTTCGYRTLSIYIDKTPKTMRINRLVASHFIQNINSKPTVNHKDGNKLNDAARNLEWATHSEQNYHAYKMNLMVSKRGEDSHYCKYPESTVRSICEMLESGASRKDISNKLNVPRSLIKKIILKESWKHISCEYKIDVVGTRSKPPRGCLNGNNTYDEDTIISICKMLRDGISRTEISQNLNVHKDLVRDIHRRRTWRHISEQYIHQ